jgi:hypothetical protein
VVGSDVSAAVEGAGDGETARLWPNWGELGQMWGGWDAGGEREVLAGADVDVGDAGGVYHTVDVETTRFRGFWGKQGGSDAFRGGSDRSPGMFRCSRAAVRGLEWGRAGNSAVVDERVDDNAVVTSCGSGRTTGG